MIGKLSANSDILGTALQASSLKNSVILNNIANVDTPSFKKSDVDFDKTLSNILDQADLTGELDLSKATPKIKTIHKGFSARLDDNNVTIETEMVSLYENSMKYDTMANSVINNYRRLNAVINLR